MSHYSHSLSLDQYFADKLESIQPKSKYISEMHTEEYVDSIYLQLINGDAEIAHEKTPFINQNQQNNKGNNFEHIMRAKMVKQAQKQRQHLEQKLSYLANSINALNRYEQITSRKSPKNVKDSFTAEQNKQRQAEWRKQMEERAKDIAKRKKLVQQTKIKKQEELKEIEEKIKQDQIQRKKKQILENVKSIQQRSKKRQQDVKERNERYKQLKKGKSLHHRLSQSFNQREHSFLEQRKKKLAQIRNLHRPLEQLDLKQHEARFLQGKRQKQQLREREKRMNESRSNSYQPFYKSVFYQRALQVQKEEGVDEHQKREKIKAYAEKIKEQHAPEIDQRKRQEIQQLIEKQKRKLQQKAEKQRQLKEKAKQKGMEYLEQVKKLPKKPRKNSADLAPPVTERKEYPNYLVRTSKQSQTFRQPIKPWNKILASKADKQQKAQLLQYQSQKFQMELKRKEKEVKLLKKGDSADIDQGYFEIIKAKLDLLNGNQK